MVTFNEQLSVEDLSKVEVTGVSITSLSLKEQVNLMVSWGRQKLSKVVCVANVHMLMESRDNLLLREALANASLVTPDGMPLVWMMRSLGASSQDRVAGMDIFENVCLKCAKEGISIYLMGSTEPVLEKMINRLAVDFPTLNIAGAESPPFRPMRESEEAEIVERINSSGAGFTFVSLGCPKQERWMMKHYNEVQSVMVGVGAVFPVYAGIQKHAPKWIRESGLEWMYRLVQEPKRLFGRYAVTIPPFVYLALKQIVQTRASRKLDLASCSLSRSYLLKE